MTLSISTGNYWNYYDKLPETPVYTLSHTGEITEWKGHRYQPEIIFLFGEIDDMAIWLQTARDKRSDLHRGVSWHLKYNFRKMLGPTKLVVVELWWEYDDTECTIGPLPSLDFAFREWASYKGLYE